MSIGKKTATEPKPTAGVQFEQPQTEEARHVRIGLDKTGAIHHYAEHESRIIVIKSCEIQHVERFDDVDNRDKVVAEWIDFIENGPKDSDKDGRGWEQQPYMTQTEFFEKGIEMGLERLSEKLSEKGSRDGGDA